MKHAPRVIGASAGSGKTTRLTTLVLDALVGEHAEPQIPVESLVAVTYTVAAAEELAARIRKALVASRRAEAASALPLAYLGTVHSVSLRLVKELALDAGLPPEPQVMTDGAAAALRACLDDAMALAERARLGELRDAFELNHDNLTGRNDWVQPVLELIELARQNRVPPGALAEMAQRASEGLRALLPRAERDGDALDRELVDALATTRSSLDRLEDPAKRAQECRALVARQADDAARGRLSWPRWLALTKLKTSARQRDAVAPLAAVAARVTRHPRLHAELDELLRRIYAAAQLGLSAYADWKHQRGLIDFVDMFDHALVLLDTPAVQDELAARLRLLVVDEFQDTSPLQLALYLRLHAVCGRSTWVGDRKQCIFEWGGADPALMDAVLGWAAARGSQPTQLADNYRSRPALVTMCSTLFAGAFARFGYAADEVIVRAQRAEPASLAALAPCGVWWLDGTNKDAAAQATAEGVRRLLAAPDATPVVDRETGSNRPLRPGDVALLVRSNAAGIALTQALEARGVRVAQARPGLMQTPEATLVQAALAWLADERNDLAAATLTALGGFGGGSPQAWLAKRIEELRADPHARVAAPAALLALRERVASCAPSELVDLAIDAADAEGHVARWPEPARGLANLDALRALARRYEEACVQQREAATLAGLLRAFDERAAAGEDLQHATASAGDVTVCTYHKAKGLEWPVVVLTELDNNAKPSPFQVATESEGEAFDPERPLEGRWLRYWPKPFARLTHDDLESAAAASSAGVAAIERERHERVRLLYVGFTRARDHLVLAVGHGKKGPMAAWLNELADDAGEPLLRLPDEDRPTLAVREMQGAAGARGAAGAGARGASVRGARGAGARGASGARGALVETPARVWTLDGDGDERLAAAPAAHVRFASRAAPAAAPVTPDAYWLTPSRAATWLDGATLVPTTPVPLGHQLLAHGGGRAADARLDWALIGTVVHAAFAVDPEGLALAQRVALVERAISATQLGTVLRAERVVAAVDALAAFVAKRWPGARWRREVPLTVRLAGAAGARCVDGIADLLLDTADGLVVIDHKTFPAQATSALLARAHDDAPQLAAYRLALEALGQRVAGTWLHFPAAGAMVELR